MTDTAPCDKKFTARDLIERLRLRYAPPEWILLEEVANGTGGNKSRCADALALSCYPSRGCQLIGFELKVSRSDVLRELKDPDKSVPLQKHCDLWYLVAPPGIVSPDEVPLSWGLLLTHGAGFKLAKAAKQNDEAPKAWSRTFVASLVRSAFKQAPADTELAKARDEGFRSGQSQGNYEGERAKRDLEALQAVTAAFHEASGMSLSQWTDVYLAKEQGARLRAAYKCNLETGAKALSHLANQVEAAAKRLRESAEEAQRAVRGE